MLSPCTGMRRSRVITSPPTVCDSFVGRLDFECVVDLRNRESRVHEIDLLAEHLADPPATRKILVEVVAHIDFADHLLEHVLHRDHPHGGAELVDHDRHVVRARTQYREQFVDGLMGGDVVGGSREVVNRTAGESRIDQIPRRQCDDPDYVADVLAVPGKPVVAVPAHELDCVRSPGPLVDGHDLGHRNHRLHRRSFPRSG